MSHGSKKIGIERPNAWLSETRRLAVLLDNVYAHTAGEIWLFDNDLKVLEDHDGAFELLYNDRLDGSLTTRVRCVKILLQRDLYNRFCNRAQSPQLFKNLCSLGADRLRTFSIGCLENLQPRPQQKFGGHHPWIFYLGKEYLRSRDGIVIVRPKTYPFFDKDGREDIAIAWKTSDTEELDTLRFRLDRAWFHKVFVTDYEKNFQSVEPDENGSGNFAGYHLVPARSAADLSTIFRRLKTESTLPVVPPIDCAIVTTLNEEFRAVLEVFGLAVVSDHPQYATGWHTAQGVTVSVAAVQCVNSGSVCSAETTARLIQMWNPRSVFLVGRCGGWQEDHSSELQECDVVVADSICAYEYQSLNLNDDGTDLREYDVRDVNVSPNILHAAHALIRDNWSFSGTLPKDWDRRLPQAYTGSYACGHKLIRRGAQWFKEIRAAVGKRKIIAVEMEGEGVGIAISMGNPPPEFLMIKGISDFANPQKSDKYKHLASTTAAQFLRDLLSQPETLGLLRKR